MGSENVGEDYVIRVLDRPSEIDAGAWNALLALDPKLASLPRARRADPPAQVTHPRVVVGPPPPAPTPQGGPHLRQSRVAADPNGGMSG